MDRFQWREAFSVGDEQVDGQHKRIFGLLARLHQDIHGDDVSTAVQHTLKELVDYTKTHFNDEEELMRAVGYPGYEAHKKLHDALMDKAWGLYARCNEGSPDLAFELLVFLNDWLVNHILEQDKAITAYVRNQQQGG